MQSFPERPEYKLFAIDQVETSPIQAIKAFIKQGTGIGQCGNKIRFTCN